jgi:hypothetical protein
MEISGVFQALYTLSPEKSPRYSFSRRLSEAQNRSGLTFQTNKNVLALAGIEPHTSYVGQPVAWSLY